jgi:oxygen-dependent protoporphyrinogen oxidase
MASTVVVVGAGISGLVTGWELIGRLPAAEIAVLDAAPRPGGSIRSEKLDGYLCEWGPSGFLDDADPTLSTCERLALTPRLLAASERSSGRFLVRDGKLRQLPKGPASFLTSDVLTLRGRLRVLLEPAIPCRERDQDESVFDFARRRLGREAARVLIDALVTGIWAGSSERLSIRSAFPTLASLEIEHGGLLRGMIATRHRATRLTSLPDGVEEVTAALAAVLGSRLRLNTRVTGIEPVDRGYRLAVSGEAPIDTRAVVLACPAWSASVLLERIDGILAQELATIPSVGVAVVHLGFALADAGRLPDLGFGFLVPRAEHTSVLGVSIGSNVFPGRSPDGHVLATVLLGGARDPAVLQASDDQLAATASAALLRFAGVASSPRLVRVVRHTHAIPQYVLGHAERLTAIDERLRNLPGLFLTGNAYRGIAINACIADGLRTAAVVARDL